MKKIIFGIGRYTTIRNMNAFTQRHQQAEKTIELLKRELAVLTQLADAKQKTIEKKEIEKIRAENSVLQRDLQQLKSKLQYYETQNGVKQISVPIRTKSQDADCQPAVVEEKQSTRKPSKQEEQQQPKQQKKKEKKGDKTGSDPKKKSGGGGAAAEKPKDVSRLKLTVGKIIEAKKHPDADGLLVETVDFGEERPRTVCSGIVQYYKPEDILNRLAIFATNLKPVKMRGISSEGMIMCASKPGQSEIIDVPKGAQIGDRVTCPDFSGEADEQLNPKKKIFEQVQPDFLVNADGVATYKGSPFQIEGKGICTLPTMRNCGIK